MERESERDGESLLGYTLVYLSGRGYEERIVGDLDSK